MSNNHPNRAAFSIPVSKKLIDDLLEHLGGDPVTNSWCVEADTMADTPRRYVVEVLDETKPYDVERGVNVKKHYLTNKVIRAGLVAMTSYPKRIGEIFDEESHDAPLADLFVQFCVFGEEKYA